tara:strand:- start:374 stop:616 length:243 start_codon:yes stop_codon:yes gene_type:complete
MQRQKDIKKDSKKKSLLESAFDIGTGYLMYVPINYFILPLFLDTIANQEIFGLLQISALFTCVALIRKYTIRRWFSGMRS